MSAWRACNACGASGPKLLHEAGDWHVVQCARCGLVYVGEDPASIDFASLYDEGYYTGERDDAFADYLGQAPARRAAARRRVWSMRRLVPRGRLLDVGCAAGFFLVEARRHYTVQGVELSAFSSDFARRQFGLEVFTGTLQQARLPASRFELVTLWDVIEHVSDPRALLAEVARVLAPGGRVVLTTGDIGSAYARERGAQWHLMTPPWHLYFFSRETLATLARAVGLRVVSIAARGVAGDSRWARSRPGLLWSHLTGRGDIMQATLAPAA